MTLLDAAKVALQEMLEDSGRRRPDDQPFLEAIAELRRAIERAERGAA